MTKLLLLLALTGNLFAFGRAEAPDGNEWKDPQRYSLNKELPHNWFFSFADRQSAMKVLPENSTYWKSLDGIWKFNWAPVPEERPGDFYRNDYDVNGWDNIKVPSNWQIEGIQRDGTQKYGTPIYVNVRYPFWYEVEVDDWKNGVMRTPPEEWTMFKARNEVGFYKRTFTVPDEWKGMEVFIDFDGVDSFFYLWINGKYVGFSKNSRNAARFNISRYLVPGENQVAVEVYRNGDGSFFEAQDMFRLSGIFRTVALEAKPKIHVRDIKVTPGFEDSLKTEGVLNIQTDIAGEGDKGGRGLSIDWHLYKNRLYSDELEYVASFKGKDANSSLACGTIGKWSAEAPHRYTLVGELKSRSGKVLDVFSTVVGFRDVEIKDTPASEDEFGIAGRYFYVNGKPVKLRGVNRHETAPEVGHAIGRDVMEKDLMMMKRANINHVRNSHYPDDPYWYYLCDKYGIYLIDEANIESHPYHYGKESLSHVPEFRGAHVARMMEMMHSNYNHPSVIIWSMGNEAGPGVDFAFTYVRAKEYDPMRPVQYERNNNVSDIGCRQYPEVDWVRRVASGKAQVKYPYHINEFAHSMGNALGDFADYWKIMDSNNHFIGGAVWDWVDQSLYNYGKDGTEYLAYGGDFGDFPNDGQFVMNGLVFGDRTPKPQYWEVQKVYQPIYTRYLGDGRIEVFNRNYFESIDAVLKYYTVYEDDIPPFKEKEIRLEPRTKEIFELEIGELPEGVQSYILLDYVSKKGLPWTNGAESSISFDHLLIQEGRPYDVPEQCRVSGFRVEFDDASGTLARLSYDGADVIIPGEGPVLNPFRAFVNNDGWIYKQWFAEGLDRLEHHTVASSRTDNADGSYSMKYTVESYAPNGSRILTAGNQGYHVIEDCPELTDVVRFTTEQVWTVYPDGRIVFDADISSSKPQLIPGRMGFLFKLPAAFDKFSYYGLGPWENYCDRKTASFMACFGGEVSSNVTPYTKPQDMGNHEDVSWVKLSDGKNCGIMVRALGNSVKGAPVMSMSVLPYSAMELVMAAHPHQLPRNGDTVYLTVDAAVLGLGGQSCGPAPQEKNRIYAAPTRFSFEILPVSPHRFPKVWEFAE